MKEDSSRKTIIILWTNELKYKSEIVKIMFDYPTQYSIQYLTIFHFYKLQFSKVFLPLMSTNWYAVYKLVNILYTGS